MSSFGLFGTGDVRGRSGTLQLDDSASFSGTVAGMTPARTRSIFDINFAKVHTPSFTGRARGTLTVTDGVHTADIALIGNYMASVFVPRATARAARPWSIRPPSAACSRSSPRRTPEGYCRETIGMSRHVAAHGVAMRLCF